MSYLAVNDVESQVQGFSFTADSHPSKSEVEEFIAMVEAEVNGLLSTLGIVIPIDSDNSPESFKIAKLIASQGVLALTLGSMHSMTMSEETTREEACWKRYNSWVNSIVKAHGAQLHDAEHDTSGTDVVNATVALGNQWWDKEPAFGFTEFTKIRDVANRQEQERSRLRTKQWRTELS